MVILPEPLQTLHFSCFSTVTSSPPLLDELSEEDEAEDDEIAFPPGTLTGCDGLEDDEEETQRLI